MHDLYAPIAGAQAARTPESANTENPAETSGGALFQKRRFSGLRAERRDAGGQARNLARSRVPVNNALLRGAHQDRLGDGESGLGGDLIAGD